MLARLLPLLAAVALVLFVPAAEAAASHNNNNNNDDEVDIAFANFKSQFNKSYANEVDQRRARHVFESHMKRVAQHNASNATFSMIINEFSDMTAQEFKSARVCKSTSSSGTPSPSSSQFGNKPPQSKSLGTMVYSGKAALPKSVDWVAKGAVTAAKNQGNCGSCWSFSATGALEAAWFIAGHGLTSLAEQEFVDCDEVDHGCDGGEMDDAFKFAELHGVCTERSYPYLATRGGECNNSSCKVGIPRGSVVGFHNVAHTEEAMMEAVAQQPISIGIEADQASFQFYGNGIITTGCGDQLDHGVLLVGYGTLNGSKYWKVKNSWGPSWGMDGYVLIARGVEGQGECGIRGDPSFPVVKKAVEIVA